MNRLRGDKVDGSKNYELEGDEECLKPDPRKIYCHIKGCRKMGDFQVHPGMELLCEDHEPHNFFRGGINIPNEYWQWKDEEEWKTLGDYTP